MIMIVKNISNVFDCDNDIDSDDDNDENNERLKADYNMIENSLCILLNYIFLQG